ncbi:MAG: H(+)/Cl(-) exchange transporter ClcA [Legionellaceae bacterium]|nr:H(+)/Cl(-) exchange transporter ClcA [Legionellaceae bacterium]
MRYRKILLFYLAALLVGLLTGVVGSFFQLAIDGISLWTSRYQGRLGMLGIPGWLSFPCFTVLMVLGAWFLVRGIAPEASGSGVQEIEGALLHERSIRWWRVLPVKFIGGVLSIASGMVLGREGPTIQMGGNIGQFLGRATSFSRKRCDALVAAGAAAGLATAFNAPLAGVLFVMEEMRRAFPLSFLHFKTVAISCVAATVALQFIVGGKPSIVMDVFDTPSLASLGLFLLLGIVVGFIAMVFNRVLMRVLFWMDKHTVRTRFLYVVSVAILVGGLAWLWPDAVGGGYHIIERSLTFTPGFIVLTLLFLMRFVLTVLCYGTGVPGGIFAPMLALGTLVGLAISIVFDQFLPAVTTVHPGMFAVAAMGALFSASVRAPITGIVLVVEMTQNYGLILPLMASCLMATTVVQLAGVSPIYTQLLRRALVINKV